MILLVISEACSWGMNESGNEDARLVGGRGDAERFT
jgi:hypothetical protein